MHLPLFFGLTLSLAIGSITSLSGRDYRVTVPASDVARAAQAVTFKLPADASRDAISLQDGEGRHYAVQVTPDGSATFLVPRQPALTPLVLTLRTGTAARPDAVTIAAKGPRLDVSVSGRRIFSYWAGERPLPRPDIEPLFLRGGFIHPLFSPNGVPLTDSYPEKHVHHHGIWSPWTKTKFQGRNPDFWNMGAGKGKVEFVALDRQWGGPVHGGFVARHRFVDLTASEPVVALHETWKVTVYDLPGASRPARVFDLVITQTCATDDPLILPEYHYGGLGYRGSAEWNGAANTRFLTSEGVTDRVKAHGTRARWCHIGGEVEGRLAGTAILGHPSNFRAPQPMRIHPNEPFFCYAPSQLGDWQIKPGEPYVARYRFVAMDGPPDAALLDAYWAGYARPATAIVEAQ